MIATNYILQQSNISPLSLTYVVLLHSIGRLFPILTIEKKAAKLQSKTAQIRLFILGHARCHLFN